MSPSLAICIMHASFIPERKAPLERLIEKLDPLHPAVRRFHVERDMVGQGPWPVARACWEVGIASEASHIIVFNDDALPCDQFVEVACSALSARPNDIVSFYTNHEVAKATDAHWYTSNNGLVGVGHAMPREVAQAFISFVDNDLAITPVKDDDQLNVFAMATGRRVWTTVPSLVDHQLPDASTVGHERHPHRRPVVPPREGMVSIDWTVPVELNVPHVGCLWNTNWNLIREVKPSSWRAYDCVRKAYALEQDRIR